MIPSTEKKVKNKYLMYLMSHGRCYTCTKIERCKIQSPTSKSLFGRDDKLAKTIIARQCSKWNDSLDPITAPKRK
jgi:hypothetical protein